MRYRSLLAAVALGTAALLAVGLAGAPNAAGGGAIIVATDDNQFSPADVTIGQGTTASWWFGDGTHTSTSNQRFWNSGPSSAIYRRELPSAGTFPYHCTIHAGMAGQIVVPLKSRGSATDGWRLRWSAARATRGRAFDVQYRLDGATTWSSFRSNTTAPKGLFNPQQPGTYELRARTSNTAAGRESGWAPVIRRSIS